MRLCGGEPTRRLGFRLARQWIRSGVLFELAATMCGTPDCVASSNLYTAVFANGPLHSAIVATPSVLFTRSDAAAFTRDLSLEHANVVALWVGEYCEGPYAGDGRRTRS